MSIAKCVVRVIANKTALQVDVQKHALSLMRREHRDSPFHDDTVAKANSVRGYDRDKDGECCSVEQFCLDLAGTPASPWNASATRVFVEDFLNMGQFDCTDSDAVKVMFSRHFRTLQRHYKKQSEDRAAEAEGRRVDRTSESREHARDQRKYNVSSSVVRDSLRV